MMISKDTKFLIVGLGLIGGSYAKALTKKGYTVNAITRSQSSIDYAIKNGIISNGTTEISEDLIKNADVIVFSLYPHIFIEWIKENQHLFSSGTIITDVTGVKTSVVYEIQSILRDDVEFIAAHPMAGREVYGVENSDEKIFNGANYIVTPTKKNTESATVLCEELGELLGFAKVSRLSPEEHDDMIGFLSQLTHCIAITLMTCNESEKLQDYTGDSFRDLTRISKINDAMWSELFLMNKDYLLKNMDDFIAEFNRLRNMLSENDVEGMRKMMRRSTERRALFDKKQ